MRRRVWLSALLLAMVMVVAATWRHWLVMRYGYSPTHCVVDASCDGLIGIDCGASHDGLYAYHEASSGRLISTCGGACMSGCTNCPPREWHCPGGT